MAQVLILLVVVLVVASVGVGVTALIRGSDPGLVPSEPDGRSVPLPGRRTLTEQDVSDTRFDLAVRGYRMAQVDRAMDRVAYDIGYKSELISVLEAEVDALRDGRIADADALREARMAAGAPAVSTPGAAEAGSSTSADGASAADSAYATDATDATDGADGTWSDVDREQQRAESDRTGAGTGTDPGAGTSGQPVAADGADEPAPAGADGDRPLTDDVPPPADASSRRSTGDQPPILDGRADDAGASGDQVPETTANGGDGASGDQEPGPFTASVNGRSQGAPDAGVEAGADGSASPAAGVASRPPAAGG